MQSIIYNVQYNIIFIIIIIIMLTWSKQAEHANFSLNYYAWYHSKSSSCTCSRASLSATSLNRDASTPSLLRRPVPPQCKANPSIWRQPASFGEEICSPTSIPSPRPCPSLWVGITPGWDTLMMTRVLQSSLFRLIPAADSASGGITNECY